MTSRRGSCLAYEKYDGMSRSTNCSRGAVVFRVSHALWRWSGSIAGGFGAWASLALFAPAKVPK